MNQEKTAPVVFISYSHGSDEHEQWVLELAQELRGEHGIDVILDKWDLDLGADIARFMKEDMGRCDFVLMICTETYVEKADAGKGGVGYETMIVDSELIHDVGKNKFIPIIRQESGGILLPKSVSTRLAVDLSEGKNREEGMQKLRETLHSLPPPTKPPLSGGPSPVGSPAVRALPPSQYPSDPSGLYDAALHLAQTGDLPAWRRLVEKKKVEIFESLHGWREHSQRPLSEMNEEADTEIKAKGLKVLEPLFAVALAGVESGLEKFNRQAGLVHDLLKPPSWKRSGLSILVDFPEAAVFVFQALLGTFAVYSGQPKLVFDLANQRVQPKHRRETTLLWDTAELIGWPDFSGPNCYEAWRFLWNLPEQMTWVKEKLADERRFRGCLCGHYFLLSFVEFVARMRGQSQLPDGGLRDISVPPLFAAHDEFSAGLRDVLNEKQQLLEYIRQGGVASTALRESWLKWVERHAKFLNSPPHYFEAAKEDYKHFMEDLLS